MMRFCPIASGSSGNCIYVGSERTHLLVDAGISGKRIDEGINRLELNWDDINGILITHEHVDHISGLGVVLRKHHIPVYASFNTIEAIKNYKYLGNVDEDLFCPILPDEDFLINDINIRAMKTMHDAVDPVAYRFTSGDKSVAIATDMGCFSDYTVDNLKKLDAILLEANHDVRMLQVGPYPYSLKKRILGDNGHLSNETSGRLLAQIAHDDLKHVYLGHLSKENNMPELAYETVRVEIELADNKYRANDFNISVAKRDEISDIIHV